MKGKAKSRKRGRYQPRDKYPKIHTDTRLDELARGCVEEDARRFNCTKSFVIATALREFYSLQGYERFFDPIKPKAGRNGSAKTRS